MMCGSGHRDLETCREACLFFLHFLYGFRGRLSGVVIELSGARGKADRSDCLQRTLHFDSRGIGRQVTLVRENVQLQAGGESRITHRQRGRCC